MPTLGRTTEAGLVSAGGDAGRSLVTQVGPVPAGGGLATSLSAYYFGYNANWSEAILLLYADNSGVPGALLGRTDAFFSTPDGAPGWRSAPLRSNVTLTEGALYWVGVQIEHDAMLLYAESDIVGALSYQIPSGTFDAPPNPWTGGTLITDANSGAYITYTAGDAPPTLSGGAPTGSGGTTRTLSFTTTKTSGTARIVVDTAANLDAVTNTQVAAGQKENGTAAAYDSGNKTVSGTTVSHEFTGLAPGNWRAAAVHDGSAVLFWDFVVVAQNPMVRTPALQFGGVNVGAQTNVEYRVYAGHNHDGARRVSGNTGVINSSSVFELDNDLVGSVGDAITVALYFGDEEDNKSVLAKTTVIDGNA